MFLGGGLARWAGTTAYDLAGWTGISTLFFAMSVGMVTLSSFRARQAAKAGKGEGPPDLAR